MATCGCQSRFCFGRKVDHHPAIRRKPSRTTRRPRQPRTSPNTAASNQVMEARVRRGADVGKSKYRAPAAHTTTMPPMINTKASTRKRGKHMRISICPLDTHEFQVSFAHRPHLNLLGRSRGSWRKRDVHILLFLRRKRGRRVRSATVAPADQAGLSGRRKSPRPLQSIFHKEPASRQPLSPVSGPRGKSDLSAVGLDFCIAIRCDGLRFPFRVKPKLDALLPDEAGDVPVTAPKRLFAILNRAEDRAGARHLLTTIDRSKTIT